MDDLPVATGAVSATRLPLPIYGRAPQSVGRVGPVTYNALYMPPTRIFGEVSASWERAHDGSRA
jgi:hypothetical protein